MGDIAKNLGGALLNNRNISSTAIWADLCEDIHLHYRNLRINFSEREWAEFICAIKSLYKATEAAAAKYRYEEGDNDFLVNLTYNTPLKRDSEYYPNRTLLELQKDDTVHFHYRDLRLHWNREEFNAIADMFIEARMKVDEKSAFPYMDVTEEKRGYVPIDSIQPYDAGHRRYAIDNIHREGIDKCKELIMAGKKIRPILVDNKGIRLDGFKRYMAFKELGHPLIEVIVDPYPEVKGGQSGMSWIEE
jgi:hypothetical protein